MTYDVSIVGAGPGGLFTAKSLSEVGIHPVVLETFWRIHDPTSLNRQGPDVGSQYRSVIFFHNQKQKEEAILSKEKHEKENKIKIVTEIVPAKKFWKAEEYHQKYLEKQGLSTCGI